MKQGFFTAHFIEEKWCKEVTEVEINCNIEKQIFERKDDLIKLIGGIRTIVNLECANTKSIKFVITPRLQATHKHEIVLSKENNWKLVFPEEPTEEINKPIINNNIDNNREKTKETIENYTYKKDWSEFIKDDRLFPAAVYDQMFSGRGLVNGDLLGGKFTGRKDVRREELAKEANFRFKSLAWNLFGIKPFEISKAIVSGMIVPYFEDLRLIEEGLGKPSREEILADPTAQMIIEWLKENGSMKPNEDLPSEAHLINVYYKFYRRKWNAEFGTLDDIGVVKTVIDGKEMTMDGNDLRFYMALRTTGSYLRENLGLKKGEFISYKEILTKLNARQLDILQSEMASVQSQSIASFYAVMRDDYNDLRTKIYIPSLAEKANGATSSDSVEKNLIAKNKRFDKNNDSEAEYNVGSIQGLFAKVFIGEKNLDRKDEIIEAALSDDKVTYKRDIRDVNYASITLCNKSNREIRIASLIEWKPSRSIIDNSIESKLLVNGWAYIKPGECKSVRTGLANAVVLCFEEKNSATGRFELALYSTKNDLDFNRIIEDELLNVEDYEVCVNPFGDFHFVYDNASEMEKCKEFNMKYPFKYFIKGSDNTKYVLNIN